MVHTAIFDAWAAYDPIARGTRLGTQLRRPAAERTPANKNKAISFAAYKALVDLFPARQFDFAEQMSYLGYGVDGSDASTPVTVGNTAARRSSTTATPMGPISSTAMPTPPATSRSTPATRSSTPGAGSRCGCRSAAAPSSGPPPPGGNGKGFALQSPWQFAVPGPDRLQSSFDPKHIDNLLALTSNLSDRQKVTAEFWADGPRSEFPRPLGADHPGPVRKRPQPGHRRQAVLRLGQRPDGRQHRRLGGQVPLGLRPPHHRHPPPLQGQGTSWLGPYQAYGTVAGEQWIPYQDPRVVTPPFPEYVSGPQHLQLGRLGHPGQVHRQRQLRGR